MLFNLLVAILVEGFQAEVCLGRWPVSDPVKVLPQSHFLCRNVCDLSLNRETLTVLTQMMIGPLVILMKRINRKIRCISQVFTCLISFTLFSFHSK